MNITWLIITNATHAFVYDISNKTKHTLIHELTHPEGRLKGRDLVTDRPGNYQSTPADQGSFFPDTSPHEVTLRDFAIKIALYLEHESTQNHFGHLIIVAEPHFHGVLNKHFSKHTKSLIKHSIQKNYVPLPTAKLAKAIADIQHEYF